MGTPWGWNRIIARSAPRMTAGQALERKPAAPEHAVSHDGLDGIGGTGGIKPTGGGKHWRDAKLVNANG